MDKSKPPARTREGETESVRHQKTRSFANVGLLSELAFCAFMEEALDLVADSFASDARLWDIGIDSATVIELVLVLESLGVEVPDDLEWERATGGDIYALYTNDHGGRE